MGQFKNLVGNRYGSLTVIADLGSTHQGAKSLHLWQCRCDCGNVIVRNTKNFYHSNSCGCKTREHKSKATTIHGGKGTRLFNIWCGMRERCQNKNIPSYKNYGGKGISVCNEWLDFATFRDWAIANGYSDSLSIDRINNDGNYEPGNCRWADRREQNNNRSCCHLLTYKGETHDMKQWSEITGIPYDTIRGRINRYHWSVERALSTK